MKTLTTLQDFLEEIGRLGSREAVRYFNGYRTEATAYETLYYGIGAFVRELDSRDIRKGDRVLLWGENRTEWLMAFWGCIARGVVVVPIDFRISEKFAGLIQQEVAAKLLVHTPTVPAENMTLPRLTFGEVATLPPQSEFPLTPAVPEDIVEIVYTSGTTGDPKGVVHRHKNICANLRPIQHLFNSYKPVTRFLPPVRTLNVLPLSHMFGQTMSLFLPILIEGCVVFMRELSPGAVLAAINREEVVALVAVPHLMDNLRSELIRRFGLTSLPDEQPGFWGLLRRIWQFRRVHRACGWRFWFMVVGGSQVKNELESFWRTLGFDFVQGYGLTETSPVISVNFPLKTRKDSLGKVMDGMEARIAPDGEILVRGDSVVQEYYNSSVPVQVDGWFHTGDMGSLDDQNRLWYRGRKKDVIVTADGMNVYPQDVEEALNRCPEIKDSAVVGVRKGGHEQVHAAVIPANPNAALDPVIQQVNAVLESHQRIRGWSIWPDDDFPRTASTYKIKHREIASRLAAGGAVSQGDSESESALDTLARMCHRDVSELNPNSRLAEDVGLSSLEWMEFLSAMENRYGVELDEETFADIATVGELVQWIEQPQVFLHDVPAMDKDSATPDLESAGTSPEVVSGRAETGAVPTWPQWLPVVWIRSAVMHLGVLPWLRWHIKVQVEGAQHLQKMRPPALFAANHISDLDIPVLLQALPRKWRRCIAPAIRQNYFEDWFAPHNLSWLRRLYRGAQYYLSLALLNGYLLPLELQGVRRSLQNTGALTEMGCCPLVFPEGHRTRDGKLQAFQPGIGLMAQRLGLPVIPVYIDGLYKLSTMHRMWPKHGEVCVHIGVPIYPEDGGDYLELARKIEQSIRTMAGI